MFRDKICSIKQNVNVRHRRTNTQFLKNIMHEEQLEKVVRAQEIQMTAENPMIKEQKLKSQICSELKQLEQEKFLEEKRKDRLHQNEEEVRLLNVQIKRAHIQRELAEQKVLREKKQREEMQERLEENKRFEEECRRNREIFLEEERKNVEKKAKFRRDILKQMEEKEEKCKLEREFVLKERASMQRFLKSFEQDQERERQHMLELKELEKQDRDEYLKQVKLYKTQQKVDAEEDHRKYMEMIRQRDETEKMRIQKRKENTMKREALSERIGQQVYAQQMKQQQHNDFLLELLIEERLAKDDERYKQKLEKQIQTAKSLKEDFERSRLIRRQEKLFRQQEDMKVVKEQLKMFQEQESKELDIRNSNISKSRQYCQDLLQTIKNKQLELEFEATQNKKEYQQQLALQQKRLQDIETEKLRLLKAEPLEIWKFLPVKAISDKHRFELGLTCKEIKEKV
ncbi:trichohyalin-like [Lucilia sericata]|uniref:trichohyalin-like n=1 Tax=Lucilia sericata TaxID=13632 RepID=UPI0018A87A98|nr:trichohyalin-like [Lucilia sericata]